DRRRACCLRRSLIDPRVRSPVIAVFASITPGALGEAEDLNISCAHNGEHQTSLAAALAIPLYSALVCLGDFRWASTKSRDLTARP
ncbi:MAG: hypothetical protein ACO3JL_15295, partial [Myxococcota bacterium]